MAQAQIKLGSYVIVTVKSEKEEFGQTKKIVEQKVGIVSAINDKTYGVHILNNSETRPIAFTQVEKSTCSLNS